MIGSVERYRPSSGHGRGRSLLFGLLKLAVLTVVLILLARTFLIASFETGSTAMQPLLDAGDRVLVSQLTYGAQLALRQRRLPGIREPQRGDVVVVIPPFYPRRELRALLEPAAAVFNRNGGGVQHDDGAPMDRHVVQRVIGVPGDTVRMRAFVAFIRPHGSNSFLSEYELLPELRTNVTAALPAGWQPTFPLTGNYRDRTLGSGEYFVLGDNRPAARDSRLWGPVGEAQIVGRVFARYWPVERLAWIGGP